MYAGIMNLKEYFILLGSVISNFLNNIYFAAPETLLAGTEAVLLRIYAPVQTPGA
jgi:hypothetical protein